MSIIDTLIYDRTQEDVDRVFTLKNKILTHGLSALTADERADYMSGLKGAYNYTDLNRVGAAVAYIAERMITLPDDLEEYRESLGVAADPAYDVPYNPTEIVVTAKQDWTVADVPTRTQITNYLNDLQLLKEQIDLPADVPDVPETLDYLSYETANDMEYLLYVIDDTLTELSDTLYRKIAYTVSNFAYSGIAYSGL